jgi:hypothetical protein
MAITEAYTGTATIGTTLYSLPNASTTLTPITVDGVYQVFMDFSTLSILDQYEVTIIEKVRSTTNQLDVFTAVLTGGSMPLWVSPSLILLHGWDVQVRKLSGTDRSISWSIRQVA